MAVAVVMYSKSFQLVAGMMVVVQLTLLTSLDGDG